MEVSKGERLYIGIFGNTNSGKSSLMNLLTGQKVSIVSDTAGTTTDCVQKNFELDGVGPAVLIDTAGFDDDTELGKERLQKTYEALGKCDVILAVISAEELLKKTEAEITNNAGFQKLITSKKPIVWVVSKSEVVALRQAQYPLVKTTTNLKNKTPIFIDSITQKGKNELLTAIKSCVPKDFFESSLTKNYCNPGDNVLLVMPQDTQAPKGRLILPQVQTIRDLLDRNVCIHCCTEKTFLQTLQSLKNPPELIITDSKIFPFVYKNKPESSRLTSFSILQAAVKGDLAQFIEGAKTIRSLTSNSKVLIAEACTHSPTTEDIGTVKIPAMLKKIAPELKIDFAHGTDFSTTDKSGRKYDLIIHCGACMFNRAYMLNRQETAKENNVPMTNYGIAIAEIIGILDKI